MPDLKDYLTTEEAARSLGFHIVHVRRMLREKDIVGKKVGQMWFVYKGSVEEYKKRTAGLDKFDPRRGHRN